MIILSTDKEIQLKLVAQGHMARKWRSWYLNPDLHLVKSKVVFRDGQSEVKPKSDGKKLRNYEIFVVPHFLIISLY